jgi:hypothetical protein
MSWRSRIAAISLLLAPVLLADEQALWREYGLVHAGTSRQGKLTVRTYQMKDTTGALAAWEWIRPAKGRACDLASFCSEDVGRTVVADDNYVIAFEGPPASQLTKARVASAFEGLPNKRESSLPAILTFLPQQGIVPNSARYILGPESLKAFAPELVGSKAGFESGAEAQIADYRLANSDKPIRLAIFYYATPEMARLQAPQFKLLPDVRVKRSSLLVALVLPPATLDQADTLLSRVQYEAKITWNDIPPPSPIKPLYSLLLNIIYLSIVLSAICLTAGLIYAGMRLYRRRFGTLESDEAMITLHLTGD